MGTSPFSGVSLCSKLDAEDKCFRLQRYNQGRFEELFHEHVPHHRIGMQNSTEVIRALVVRFDQFTAAEILRSHLNSRGAERSAVKNHLRVHVHYPEPGVVRRCCGSDTVAWMDEVIDATVFRV